MAQHPSELNPFQNFICDSSSTTQIFYNERWHSHKEIVSQVGIVQDALEGQALDIGANVFLVGADSVTKIACYLALITSPYQLFLINDLLPKADYSALFDQYPPELILCDQEYYDHKLPSSNHLKVLRFDQLCADTASLIASPREAANVDVDHKQGEVILFSSGSTGTPKAIPHSPQNFYQTFQIYGQGLLAIDADDVILSPSRLFFAYGLNALNFALFSGARYICPTPRFESQAILKSFLDHPISVLFTVPTIYSKLLEALPTESTRSIRYFISAGEKLGENIFNRWHAKYAVNITDGVGSTESLCTFISNRPGEERANSSGLLAPQFKGKLLNTQGIEINGSGTGRLILEGPTLTQGYLSDDPSISGLIERNGFDTNDVYFRDNEGYYYYQGRSNNIFKSGGQWIYPLEIEEIINQCAWVRESMVVPKHNQQDTYTVQAYVVLSDPLDHGEERLWEEALRSEMKQYLPSFKIPKLFEHTLALPRTATGKIKRPSILPVIN